MAAPTAVYKVRRFIAITTEQDQALKREAALAGTSVNAVVRNAVDAYLKEQSDDHAS